MTSRVFRAGAAQPFVDQKDRLFEIRDISVHLKFSLTVICGGFNALTTFFRSFMYSLYYDLPYTLSHSDQSGTN
jgi:hypothetical protein